jgi:hypothetical protein
MAEKVREEDEAAIVDYEWAKVVALLTLVVWAVHALSS